MKCLIIDDEPLAREGMELNIEEVDDLELIEQFENPVKASEYLSKNEVDLLFLDVEMPEMDGLEFLRSLQSKPMTILTTAYKEYALQGFELGVIDYLVKPISMERFVKAVNKARELHQLKQNADKKGNYVTSEKTEDHIYLKADRKYVKVMLNDITYIEGMKDYVMVYTEDTRIMTAMNLKTIYKQLDKTRFVRVSKSYIINISKIVEVKHNSLFINDKEIPIGKTYKDYFIDNFIKNRLLER
jgi:DNA-binding LytR/AlgR family response regulator